MIKQKEILNTMTLLHEKLFFIDRRNFFTNIEDIYIKTIIDVIEDVGEKINKNDLLENEVADFIFAFQEFIVSAPYYKEIQEDCDKLFKYIMPLKRYFISESRRVINKILNKENLTSKERRISMYIITRYGELSDIEYNEIKDYIENMQYVYK